MNDIYYLSQICYIELTLSEFEMRTVDLIPNKISIPDKIELPQYVLEQSGVTLDYLTHGECTDTNSDSVALLNWTV